MKKIRLIFLLPILLFFCSFTIEEIPPQLGKSPISDIIAAMTLEEKARILVGTGMHKAEGEDGTVIGDAGGYIPGAAGYTFGIPRLGIPSSVLADGPAGVRILPIRNNDSTKTYYATSWPTGVLMASSWDLSLLNQVGAAFGNEAKEYGIDIVLGPSLNILRDPLNGRNFEYYSEDPFISGQIAAAAVNGIQSNGTGACIKHFAANNQETARGRIDVIVSERALREIYLRGFEIAIKNSQPWVVMSSYNKINGIFASENKDLLTKVLREDWRFKGYVVTDWYAGRNVVEQVKAGNDLIEPGGEIYSSKIIKAVENGDLDIKDLDRNIEAILNVLVKVPSFKNYKYSDTPDLKSHAIIARQAAIESMVLLKNERTLPFKQIKNIALFGTASYNTYIGGSGSGDVYEKYNVTIADGLTNSGYSTDFDIQELYKAHIKKDRITYPVELKPGLGAPHMTPELDISLELIEKSATNTDIAIFTIGRNAGEGEDRKIDNDFNLTDLEKYQIQQISEKFHAEGKKLIVLINTGGVIETATWKDYADAIMLIWHPGQEGGNAVADILTGKATPSGKLATTFPIKYDDLYTSKNFPGNPLERPMEVVYEEGIYVGYRYFDSFNVKTSYPFGYGLSYTSFKYDNLSISSFDFNKSIQVQVTVKNTGNIRGKEVVQLYLSAPSNKMNKPIKELKGFAKTKLLEPGDSEIVNITLNKENLASFNAEQSAWIAEAGLYMIKIGNSCENIVLSSSFKVNKEILVEKVARALIPKDPINELRY